MSTRKGYQQKWAQLLLQTVPKCRSFSTKHRLRITNNQMTTVNTIFEVYHETRNSHWNMFLLWIRAIPINDFISSPGKLVQSKTYRQHTSQIDKPSGKKDKIVNGQYQRQSIRKSHYYQSAREFSILHTGHPVHIQNQNIGKWPPGIVKRTCRESGSNHLIPHQKQTYS